MMDVDDIGFVLPDICVSNTDTFYEIHFSEYVSADVLKSGMIGVLFTKDLFLRNYDMFQRMIGYTSFEEIQQRIDDINIGCVGLYIPNTGKETTINFSFIPCHVIHDSFLRNTSIDSYFKQRNIYYVNEESGLFSIQKIKN